MLRNALRNLLAHKLRLLLSGAAVVLGVAFIAGTLTFTDTLNRTFTSLFEDTSADVNITPKAAFETGLAGTGVTSSESSVPESMVAEVAEVDGVALAAGFVQAEGVYLLDRDGEPVGTGGAPGIGTSWAETDEQLGIATMVEGEPPVGRAEIAIDTNTAEKTGYGVGDRAAVLTPGPRLVAEVVGVFKFGDDGGTAGAAITAFDLPTAQEVMLEPGQLSGISVISEDDVSDDVVADRISDVVGSGYDVKTRAEQVEDGAAALEEELSFINTFLLVFAGVALFVGSFLILNTFSMLIAQRTRELALMRALGASRRQITTEVLVEALLLGLAGATSGLAVGFGLAYALKALFGQIGLTLDGSLRLTVDAVVWSYIVGVVVTVLAAYLPARRAARVSPVAAMRADLVTHSKPLRTRTLIGVALSVVGVAALLAVTLPEEGSGLLLALGAACLLLAAITLSPVLAVPFVRFVGVLLPRLAGKTGHLARENALRNPRRTAATSSALMVGLALITGFSIIGASARASVDELVDDALAADYVVSTAIDQPFSPDLADDLREIEGVESVTQERYGVALVEGEQDFFVAYDPATIEQALNVEMASGDVQGMAGNGVLVYESVAEDRGFVIGDELEFVMPNGESAALVVGGLLDDNAPIGPYVMSLETYDSTGGVAVDRSLYVDVADGIDAAAVKAEIASAVDAFPIVDLKDAEQFKDEQRGQVDQMLMLINALLVLSVLIAALGVVNTLVLSVIERTRELGLLRALGMSRRQVRRLVRLESVVISLYGAVLGLGLGIVLGFTLIRFLRADGLTETAVPMLQLVLFLVLGGVIGVIAAALPARRAGRLKVLDAIATE
ncbi:ABC transporter permease [Nocardioides ferulae]|uniref:ABC transporter permease n=1 Tax=Nocardioides ferulae TaxID=2340821 RepID=UPI000EB0E748|nr:FtsX-like permease family protein [Nocardioides ferulae]